MAATLLLLVASLTFVLVHDIARGGPATEGRAPAPSLEYHPRLVAGEHRVGCVGVRPSDMCSVLFIGNSYTYVNDLPQVFASLARSAGQTVQADELAPSGATLALHLASVDTLKRLVAADWNVVVLQEQSQLPADPELRTQETYPAGEALAGEIRAVGAEPMLFITPARSYGWPERGFSGYAQMQAGIDDGYLTLAATVHAPAAPVGEAWAAAIQRDPRMKLWFRDGSHPALMGTYLEACVFYATVFHRSPVGLPYRSGLPAQTARLLQGIAATTVLSTPSQWGIA